MRMRKKSWAIPFLESQTDLVIEDPSLYKGKWKNKLNRDSLRLEIGIGKGGYFDGMSRMYYEEGWIGIEKELNVAAIAAKKLSNEILENRVIRDGINTVEEILRNDREPSYNLIECAGMVSKNSNGYIKCIRLEQVLSRTNYSELISNVKFRIIEILLDLEQEFGVLDNLDIDTSDKTEDEISKVNDEITKKLYFDGNSGEIF